MLKNTQFSSVDSSGVWSRTEHKSLKRKVLAIWGKLGKMKQPKQRYICLVDVMAPHDLHKSWNIQKIVPHFSSQTESLFFFELSYLIVQLKKSDDLRDMPTSGVFLLETSLATLDFTAFFCVFSAMQALPSTPSTPLKPELTMASMTYGAKESNLQATKCLKWCRTWAVFCKKQFCFILSIYQFWFLCMALPNYI